MVEATSQLYRCVAPVQPWLYYLFGTYQGPEKIIGIFFSVMYSMSKGNDILLRLKLFRTAVWKLFQNVVRKNLLSFYYLKNCPVIAALVRNTMLFLYRA